MQVHPLYRSFPVWSSFLWICSSILSQCNRPLVAENVRLWEQLTIICLPLFRSYDGNVELLPGASISVFYARWHHSV